MYVVVGIVAALGILVVLWDAFETVVLPRRVAHNVRFARIYFFTTWRAWSALAKYLQPWRGRREGYLSLYGPLSLLILLMVWAIGLVVGFAGFQWALGSHLSGPDGSPGFGTDLYMSGTTFFTLGLGDVTPHTGAARLVTVVEAGMGFGFLALIISYLPVVYQAFSRREVNVSLLDARAGTPPTAIGMFLRNAHGESTAELVTLLREWEHWCAELLESHLSYRVLAYFRSQHDNQSWLAALTAILDTCALMMVGVGGPAVERQARMTFAIARHAAVDLRQVFVPPHSEAQLWRLPVTDIALLAELLATAEIARPQTPEALRELTRLRLMYEPEVEALSHHLLMPLPPWVPAKDALDDWQSSAEEPKYAALL